MKNEANNNSSTLKLIINILLGAFIGIGAILPGLSGGVMCVVFGVYQPLMETLASPFKGVKKYWKMLLPILIGLAIGFVGFAGILDVLLENYPLPMQAAFVGLILGTFPALWKEAGEEKRTGGSWVTIILSFVLMFLIFAILGSKGDEPTQIAKLVGSIFPIGNISIKPNFFWYIVSGVICGISIIVPGMSFSSPLMCLGLFEPLTANLKALTKLDLSVVVSFVLPLGIGALATIFLLAKPVNWLFKKCNSIAYHFVLGTLLASTVLLIPIQFGDITEALFCIEVLALGFFAGYFLDLIQSKVKVN